MAGIYCQDPQFSHEMHYPGEMRVNMNKGGDRRPATSARAHHHTELKDKIIEQTTRTEVHDKLALNSNVVFEPGIIGNSKHRVDLPAKSHDKTVKPQPKKARPKGEHMGGL